MTAALQGWHPGEVRVQQKYGFSDVVRDHWRLTENFMREQHRIFHTSNLPFIPITTVDDRGRPWGSIVAGATGEIGFVTSPDTKTLNVDTQLWPGDPLLFTIRRWIESKSRGEPAIGNVLIAGLGIEFPTRRRNKFAGRIRGIVPRSDLDFQLDLEVQETLGYVSHPRILETKCNWMLTISIVGDPETETAPNTSMYADSLRGRTGNPRLYFTDQTWRPESACLPV